MFSSESLEKCCVRPESRSPGQNASNRFPMKIPPAGDENRQINRIHLAMQKFNNSGSVPVSNKSGFSSPVRHGLLKNTLKSKNYETEEGTTRNEKKSGNRYERVGAFPTIHLKRSSIRYRPIRKFNDVKIPNPEFPVNRYLSHLPELCTDLKSSTRSVLDVLQDLSGKKIQDEEDGSNKTKSKTLGGDYAMDPNAVYNPLFVQKPKPISVTMKDSMTQTLSPFHSDPPSFPNSNSKFNNDASDPKAELRRKLAKKNNEISASLSSSNPSFSIKRKIDKVANFKDDDQSPGVSAVKKSRLDHASQIENGLPKSMENNGERVKPSRKLKLKDVSSLSPCTDRLTNIFFDIVETSPKAQIFQNSSPDTHKSESISNGFGPVTPTVNGSSEVVKTPEAGSGEVTKACSGKEENQQPKLMFSMSGNKPDAATSKPSTPTFQFGLPNNTSFNFKPNGSPLAPPKDATDPTPANVKDVASTEKKNEPAKTFGGFGSSENNFGGFKLVADTPKPPAEKKTESAEVTASPTVPAPSSQSGDPQNSQPPQNTSASPPKPLFNFGQNASSGEAPKSPTSRTNVSAPSFSQNIPPGLFTFGQKPNAETSTVQTSTETSVTTSTPSTTQAPSVQNSVSSVAPTSGLFSFGQKTETASTTAPVTATTEQKPQLAFTFGQKAEAPELGQKNLFTFGQKPPETTQTNAAAATSPPTFAHPVVSFGTTTFDGSKSVGKSGAPVSDASTAPSITQPTFGVPTTQTAPTFGVSATTTPTFATTTTTTPVFGTPKTATSASGAFTTTAPAFGVPTTSQLTLGTSTATMPVFGGSTSTTYTFGASTTTTPVVGASTTTTPASATSTITPAFGTSTVTTSARPTFKFGASTTQATGFGVPTTTAPSAPGFGLGSSQSTSAFGSSTTAETTPAFAPPTTQLQPTFGTSASFGATTASTTVPTFGTATTASTSMFGGFSSGMTPSFGSPTTQNAFKTPTTQTAPAFGSTTSQSMATFGTSSTPAFGTSSTPQSTSSFGTPTTTPAFGTAPTNGFGGFSQPNGIFGTAAPVQSGFGTTTNTSVFGTSNVLGATSSQSNSGFGTSGATPTTSAFGAQPFGKPSVPGLFEQNATPIFSSANNFSQTQNIFGGKSNENKMFGAQNNFQFGSTTNTTAFTTSAPTTAAAPIFSFGGGGGGGGTNSFSFNANSSNNQKPFGFNQNEPFKFGSAASKENSGFGGAAAPAPAPAPPNFNFGSYMNNPAPNSAFDFRQTQNSSAPGFNFSASTTSSSPSVFNFGGGSASSTNSGRGFNFGTPSPGVAFGQSTPTFGVPGTFNIGSGSSQARPRAASRLRRRP